MLLKNNFHIRVTA